MSFLQGLTAAGAIYGARQAAGIRRDSAATAQYRARWRDSQTALVADLRSGRTTVDRAADYLGSMATSTYRRDRAWWDAQLDLVNALRNGRLTLRAAALNLGMIAPGEE